MGIFICLIGITRAWALDLAPVITTQPASQTLLAGSNVTFTVAASGLLLTYQWNFNNNTISGATTATYNITGVSTTNAGNYTVVVANVAGSVTSTVAILIVNKIVATVTLGNLNQIYDGSAKNISVTTVPTNLIVTLTYNGSSIPPTNARSYIVIGTITNANYFGSSTNTLIIAKSNATVTLGNLNQAYDGLAHPVTVLTAPSGLSVSLTYNASPSTPTNPGTYAVLATVNDTNYIGMATNTLRIVKSLTVSGVTAANKVYDGGTMATVSAGGASLVGIMGADVVSLGEPPLGSFSTPTVGVGKPVNVTGLTLSGVDAANYTLIQPIPLAAIIPASTVIAMGSSSNPSLPTANVTFITTLSALPPGNGTPTGNVVFKDNATVLGTSALNGGAAAIFSFTTLSHGVHSISAEYGGDANFLGSTNSLSQLVDTRPMATTDILPHYLNSGSKIRTTTLLANDTDADDDVLTLHSWDTVSTSGGTISAHRQWMIYEPPSGVTNSDSFSYVVADSSSLQTTGLVSVIILSDVGTSQNCVAVENLANNTFQIRFLGIPGRAYMIQYATNPVAPLWQALGTITAAPTGTFEFTDTPPGGSPTRIYRSAHP